MEEARAEAAESEIFRAVQDEVSDEYYYTPATVHAETLGITLPVSILILYDTAIQHGNGTDDDGLPAIINVTTQRMS